LKVKVSAPSGSSSVEGARPLCDNDTVVRRKRFYGADQIRGHGEVHDRSRLGGRQAIEQFGGQRLQADGGRLGPGLVAEQCLRMKECNRSPGRDIDIIEAEDERPGGRIEGSGGWRPGGLGASGEGESGGIFVDDRIPPVLRGPVVEHQPGVGGVEDCIATGRLREVQRERELRRRYRFDPHRHPRWESSRVGQGFNRPLQVAVKRNGDLSRDIETMQGAAKHDLPSGLFGRRQ
jgi:hypothetical protein